MGFAAEFVGNLLGFDDYVSTCHHNYLISVHCIDRRPCLASC